MPKLQFVFPDGTEARYSLEGAVFKIGRAEGNDIVLPDPRVSSHHLVLKRAASGEFMVDDLGATNPTRINGRASPAHELKDGDTLMIGDTYARYESKPAGAPSPAPALGRPGRSGVAGGTGAEPQAPGTGCFALLVATLVLVIGGLGLVVAG